VTVAIVVLVVVAIFAFAGTGIRLEARAARRIRRGERAQRVVASRTTRWPSRRRS